MATQAITLDTINAVTMKLTHASAIIDLIRCSQGGAETREHTLLEAADAALVLIDEAKEMFRQVNAN